MTSLLLEKRTCTFTEIRLYLTNMFIEKHKKTRIDKLDEIDWVAEFNFYEQGDWDDESLYKIETTPWQILLSFAILSGISAFMVVSYFL
jgi:hypothetical protein